MSGIKLLEARCSEDRRLAWYCKVFGAFVQRAPSIWALCEIFASMMAVDWT